MNNLTENKSIKFSKIQMDSLEKLKRYDVKIGQFIRSAIAEKIKTSSLKHEEVLLELKEKVNGEGKTAVEEIVGYLQEIQKKTNSF